MQDRLPFENNCVRVVISDLSLHYFTWNETQKILREINRVLLNEGVLLCRVNSTNDINYSEGQGVKIEENFYNIDGHLKRYFNEEQIRAVFESWDIFYINESKLNRYEMSKTAWEIACHRRN